MNILVLEDEPFTALDLMTALGADGHKVMGPATTIEKALALAASTPPELALLNINLPDGSGLDAARELYRLYGCRAVFVSGSPDEGHRIGDTAIGFLSKPFEAEAVLQAIEVARAVMEGRPPGEKPPQLQLYPRAAVSGVRPAA